LTHDWRKEEPVSYKKYFALKLNEAKLVLFAYIWLVTQNSKFYFVKIVLTLLYNFFSLQCFPSFLFDFLL